MFYLNKIIVISLGFFLVNFLAESSTLSICDTDPSVICVGQSYTTSDLQAAVNLVVEGNQYTKIYLTEDLQLSSTVYIDQRHRAGVSMDDMIEISVLPGLSTDLVIRFSGGPSLSEVTALFVIRQSYWKIYGGDGLTTGKLIFEVSATYDDSEHLNSIILIDSLSLGKTVVANVDMVMGKHNEAPGTGLKLTGVRAACFDDHVSCADFDRVFIMNVNFRRYPSVENVYRGIKISLPSNHPATDLSVPTVYVSGCTFDLGCVHGIKAGKNCYLEDPYDVQTVHTYFDAKGGCARCVFEDNDFSQCTGAISLTSRGDSPSSYLIKGNTFTAGDLDLINVETSLSYTAHIYVDCYSCSTVIEDNSFLGCMSNDQDDVGRCITIWTNNTSIVIRNNNFEEFGWGIALETDYHLDASKTYPVEVAPASMVLIEGNMAVNSLADNEWSVFAVTYRFHGEVHIFNNVFLRRNTGSFTVYYQYYWWGPRVQTVDGYLLEPLWMYIYNNFFSCDLSSLSTQIEEWFAIDVEDPDSTIAPGQTSLRDFYIVNNLVSGCSSYETDVWPIFFYPKGQHSDVCIDDCVVSDNRFGNVPGTGDAYLMDQQTLFEVSFTSLEDNINVDTIGFRNEGTYRDDSYWELNNADIKAEKYFFTPLYDKLNRSRSSDQLITVGAYTWWPCSENFRYDHDTTDCICELESKYNPVDCDYTCESGQFGATCDCSHDCAIMPHSTGCDSSSGNCLCEENWSSENSCNICGLDENHDQTVCTVGQCILGRYGADCSCTLNCGLLPVTDATQVCIDGTCQCQETHFGADCSCTIDCGSLDHSDGGKCTQGSCECTGNWAFDGSACSCGDEDFEVLDGDCVEKGTKTDNDNDDSNNNDDDDDNDDGGGGKQGTLELSPWVYVGPSLAIVAVGAVLVVIIVAIVIVFCVANKARKSKAKNGGLDDVELGMKSNRSSSATVSLHSDFKKILSKDVKIVEQIGQGGSGAIVYRAKWKGFKVAYKVFTTNTFDGGIRF